MKNIYAVLIFFISISLFSQDEKKLALVIGNANYDKGELKNPVNDARLIASTLDSLDFEVLLYENLETRRDMTAAIRDFGTKLPDYDVSFIYYAGHGIQINSENFLLPTKEVFEMEIDVEDYGVSVQRILKYIETEENKKINILVIDACRDNPFEANWNATRSLKSAGLAKINPPTGSIIAFSTDSGNTAPDGDGENSIYTTALSKNLLRGGISIEQVFKYVREDVLNESNGIQKPIENNTLIGDPYIINKTKISVLVDELYQLWFDRVGYIGYMFNQDDFLEINNLLDELDDLDNNHNYIYWFNAMVEVSREKSNYDLVLENLNKIKFNDDSAKNYIKYFKLKTLMSSAIELIDNSNSQENNLIYERLREAESLFMELKDIDPKNILHFNFFEESKAYIKAYFILPTMLADSYYKIGKFKESASLYKILKKYLEKVLIDNKDYFDKEPSSKNTINESLATIENDLLLVQEKIGVDANKIQKGWRNLYKKHANNTNLLMNRIYKVLSLYEFELAVDLINKTISLNPDDPEPYFMLYYVYRDKNDYSSALMNIDFAIERYKDSFYISDQIRYIGPDLLTYGGYNSIENIRIEPWELRSYKAEILEMLDNKVMMCEEYSKVLELIYETGDKELFEKYSNIISEKCDTK
jgi:tetratricopeptide (TPR) repeat protein